MEQLSLFQDTKASSPSATVDLPLEKEDVSHLEERDWSMLLKILDIQKKENGVYHLHLDEENGYGSSYRPTTPVIPTILRRMQIPEDSWFDASVCSEFVVNRDILLNAAGTVHGFITKEKEWNILVVQRAASLEAAPVTSLRSLIMRGMLAGALLSRKEDLPEIKVCCSLYRPSSSACESGWRVFARSQLDNFLEQFQQYFSNWVYSQKNWTELRDSSINSLSFPYPSLRTGQNELMAAVYRTIRDSSLLFSNAPTGIGKTLAVLFPAIKSMGEGHTDKIFYLTAKTIARRVAEKALDQMRDKGLHLKSITLTAKEKICLCPGTDCDPDVCPYLVNYPERSRMAQKAASSLEAFTRPVVEDLASKYRVCPFELSLDLSLECDCIIADYNYVFDPRIYLKRYFDHPSGNYTFLIDEAHNLVDRGREMYSAALSLGSLRQLANEIAFAAEDLSHSIRRISGFLEQCSSGLGNRSGAMEEEAPLDILPLLSDAVSRADQVLQTKEYIPSREDLISFLLQGLDFLRVINEYYDDRFRTYMEKKEGDFVLKLFCLDPSHLLRQVLDKGKASVFFSATLLPISYFIRLLGGDMDSDRLLLSSPFPRENLCLMVHHGISTRYRNRGNSYDAIAACIRAVTEGKTGNYLVFFPSYRYMHEVYRRFSLMCAHIHVFQQRSEMPEREREVFLSQFSTYGMTTKVGFAVLGGIFSEGIDLTGEHLSGAVIVGVGLPQICLERDILRYYFHERDEHGYEYAYMFPGMNKVLQASGRVIRTETDRGIVLLIDDRLVSPGYRELFPDDWDPVMYVKSDKEVERIVHEFWEG